MARQSLGNCDIHHSACRGRHALQHIGKLTPPPQPVGADDLGGPFSQHFAIACRQSSSKGEVLMPTKTFYRLRDEKQDAILRAAVHEFVKNGFTRAKISNIAQNAGISKGSVFQYFENKKELFIYCAKWSLEVFMKRLDEQMNIGDMDIYEYFQDNKAKTKLVREEGEIASFMQVVMNEPGLLDESMKSMYDLGNIYTKKLIQNGKRKGTVRNDTDDELLLCYFSAVTERFSKRWFKLYISDISEQLSAEAENAMKNELGIMLNLLRKGMGC
jgi:AcrR family transcriptional regulator